MESWKRGGKLPEKAEAAVEDYTEVVRLMEEDPGGSEGGSELCGALWGMLTHEELINDRDTTSCYEQCPMMICKE